MTEIKTVTQKNRKRGRNETQIRKICRDVSMQTSATSAKKTTKIFFTGPRVVVFVAAVVLFLLSSNFSMNVFVSEQITPDNSHTKKGRWPVAIATDTS